MNEPSTLAEPVAPSEATDATPPTPTLVEVLRKRIADTPAPLKFRDLKKDLKRAKKQSKEAFEAEVRQLLDADVLAGLAFEHPAKKAIDPPLYASTPYRSPNDRPVVSEALLRAAAVPRKLSALLKEVSGATKADKDFVGTVASELIAAARLHEHGKGKLYGLEKPLPPDPFSSGKNKTALAKLTEAARKLMATTGVPAEEIVQRLQAAMAEPTTPQPTPAQAPAVHPTHFTPPPHQPELPSDNQVEAQNDVMPTVGA